MTSPVILKLEAIEAINGGMADPPDLDAFQGAEPMDARRHPAAGPEDHPTAALGYLEDRDGFEPTADDRAWWSGFGLGQEGLDVDPPAGFPEAERDAFRAGLVAGRDAYLAELAEDDARVNEIYADRYGDDDRHDSERIDALGCVLARLA